MATRHDTPPHATRPGASSEPAAEQSKPRPALSSADRIARQAWAIDAWVTARRAREQALRTRLAMMQGRALLTECRRYAPGALLAAQAADPQELDPLLVTADSRFLRHHPPAEVAEALVALALTTSRGASTMSSPERSLP